MLRNRRMIFTLCLWLLILPVFGGCGEKENAAADEKAEALPAFTEEEVAAAEAVLAEYERAYNTRDREAILATLTDGYAEPNVMLWDKNETLSLEIVSFDPEDMQRNAYVTGGRGSVNGTDLENVIVFRTHYTLTYPEGEVSSVTGESADEKTDWKMILIREDKESPWRIDDMGW